MKAFTLSTNTVKTEITPIKIQRKTTTTAISSSDVFCELLDDVIDYDSEDFSEDEGDDDLVDYTAAIIAELNPAAKQVLDNITHCNSLVEYVKKI